MRRWVLAAVLGLALAGGPEACPYDGSGMVRTGDVRTDPRTGRTQEAYRCHAYGHVIWVSR